MSGKKPSVVPTNLHIVVRGFRGAQLVLVRYSRAGNSFQWSNDRSHAVRLTQASALEVADRAAREYGAKCATLAVDGSMVEPASARADMLNTRQARAAATLRKMRPADANARVEWENKVSAAMARTGVRAKYMHIFETVAGVTRPVLATHCDQSEWH